MIPDIPQIVIAIPPIEDFYSTPHRISSLGSRIAKTLLENAGYQVCIINTLTDTDRKRQLPIPAALAHLAPFLISNETGRSSYFTRYHRFGEEYDAVADKITGMNPSLCFISTFAFCYGESTLNLAEAIKKKRAELTVVACGAGVSVYPDYFLRDSSIDFTLSGEAETNLLPFIDYITGKSPDPALVPGLGYKKKSQRIFNMAAPPTDSSTLQPVLALTGETKDAVYYTVSVSRGCNSACRFCANHLVHGRSFRCAEPDRFAAQIVALPDAAEGKTVFFNFEDDNLLCDMPRFREVIRICRKHFPGVRFTAENGIDYRLMSDEICSELIDAGFIQFNFTLGSVDETVLQQETRHGSINRYDALLALCRKNGCKVITYIICGFPEDTQETISRSFRFLIEKETIIGVSLFYPVPCLPGFRDLKIFDNLSPTLCCGSSAWPWNNSLSTETLVTAFRIARVINCMHSFDLTDQEHEVITRTIETGSLHTMVKNKGEKRVVEVPRQDKELVRMVFNSTADLI